MKRAAFIICLLVLTGFSLRAQPGDLAEINGHHAELKSSIEKSELFAAPILSQEAPSAISFDIAEGNAWIWYLFHSGWAVKTQNYFLIFDYWENAVASDDRTLENGFINPREIADQNVIVFISHAHSDHYDPVVLSWPEKIPKLTYIWGWNEKSDSSNYRFDSTRTMINIGAIKIYNIHHNFDGIPESAFLIHLDGLWLYHAGDHGHSKGADNKIFKENIDYLASVCKTLDLMFTPTWGGEFYAMQQLAPGVVFPMHDGGYEHQYEKFALKVKNHGLPVQVGVAKKRGDHFFYTQKSKSLEKKY